MNNEIKELREKLNFYNHKYYVEADPVVSDFDYDLMLRWGWALHPEDTTPRRHRPRGQRPYQSSTRYATRFTMLQLSIRSTSCTSLSTARSAKLGRPNSYEN